MENSSDGTAGPVAAAEVMDRAAAYRKWTEESYHSLFIRWLENEAFKPMPMAGDQTTIISGAARSNTFREVLEHLREETRRASIALGE